MPIQPLLELRVAHPFFASGQFAAARIEPRPATADRLRGLRLIAKQVAGALTVFVEFDDAGQPRIPIAAGTTLDFDLLPLPAGLAQATDPAALAPGTVFVDDGPGKPLKATLPDAGGRTARPRIEIALAAADVAAAAAGTPRVATLALSATAARWCYHLVTNLPNPLAEWRIAAGGGADAGPAVTFDDAGRAELTAADAGDAFGSDLLRRSVPFRVLRFVSAAPVAASETPARRLALFAGASRLFAALPNPSPGQLRRIGGEPAFGEVVRIVTT